VSRHNKGKRRPRPRTTAPQVPPRPPRRPGPDRAERPKTPWHPFPLIELAVFIGLICIVIGFFGRNDTAGRTILALGFALGSLGGLDTAVREHFAGYRSHTLVLSAFPTVVVTVLSVIAGLPNLVIPPLAVFVFVATFAALRRVWDRTANVSSA
jgi:hypothetical protein